MLVTIEVDLPEQTVRQYEEAGIDARARKMVQDGLPMAAPLPKGAVSDPQNAKALAMLRSWIREDGTSDPQKLAEAEAAVEELKRRLNANRAENGERLLFP